MLALVTGGAGRLGLNVCATLLREGFDVRVLELDTPSTRTRVKGLRGRADVRWGDITVPASTRSALDGADAVIHLAGILPPVTDRDPRLAWRVNVGGTKVLLDLLRGSRRAIPLVFASSVAVFGATPEAVEPLSPGRNPPNPQEPYAETKWECEQLIRGSGIDHAILRLPAAFGIEPGARALMCRLPLENRFEFCHPANTVRALVNAMRNFELVDGETLVVSGGPSQRMTYGRMLASVLGVLGLPLPPARRFSRTWYCTDWYDTERSESLLRYQHRTFADFLDEVGRMVFGHASPVAVPLMCAVVGPLLGECIVRWL
jgi:nucleoside-diphosphate-sugar epimerase